MASTNPHSDKFPLRMPAGMRERLRRAADANRRSMNSEIVHYLDRALKAQEPRGAKADVATAREIGAHKTRSPRRFDLEGAKVLDENSLASVTEQKNG